MVIDHTSYAVSDTKGDHTLIAADNFIKSDVILGSKSIEVRPEVFQLCSVFYLSLNMWLIIAYG